MKNDAAWYTGQGFFPQDLTEKFKFVKSIGFECFEIDGKVLMEKPDEIKRAIQGQDFRSPAPAADTNGWIGDFIEEKRLNGIADLKVIIRNLKEVGGTGVVVPAAWGCLPTVFRRWYHREAAKGTEKRFWIP